ncbi:LytTR family DNA-binding domain-containing protein [Niabella terrae]
MITALLIDDEERATDSLRLMIDKFIPEINQVRVCNDAVKAVTLIHKIHPDLIFLDIRMPYLSGFELLDRIPKKNFKVIFTTAYDEYAIKSIKFSAFDYLLKPIDAEELILAVKRFLQTKDDNFQQQELFKNISVNMQSPNRQQYRLALPSRQGVHFLFPSEIIRCVAEGNYTRFYTIHNKQHLISRTLGEYEELLGPYNFIRSHKSHLVNKNYIAFIDHDGFLTLTDQTKIELSRRRKAAVIEALRT